MNNTFFEEYYKKYIEPIYGDKRDIYYDSTLTNNIFQIHEYSIPFQKRYDFTKQKVYSIDPDGCLDADDAFSIYEENKILYLAIHIADPTEYIQLHSDLWKDISKRTTTKYLSNHKPIHMLPSKILEITSLMTMNEDKIKNSLTILTEIDKNNYKPTNKMKLLFSKIKVQKDNALTYYDSSILKNEIEELKIGIKISKELFKLRKNKASNLSNISNAYIKYTKDGIPYLYQDTKDEKEIKNMISEFAILSNSFIANLLKVHLKLGIFRNCSADNFIKNIKTDITGEEIMHEIIKNGIKANYEEIDTNHDLVGVKEYTHFTSPIRRLSDCICHYLVKHIYLYPNKSIPLEQKELKELSEKCSIINKRDKKNYFKDNKFRLLQVMKIMIEQYKNINIEYYISNYTGLYINIVICKINDFNVYMSYSLRNTNYTTEINSNKKHKLKVHYINSFQKYDQNTIPELDNEINKSIQCYNI